MMCTAWRNGPSAREPFGVPIRRLGLLVPDGLLLSRSRIQMGVVPSHFRRLDSQPPRLLDFMLLPARLRPADADVEQRAFTVEEAVQRWYGGVLGQSLRCTAHARLPYGMEAALSRRLDVPRRLCAARDAALSGATMPPTRP
jgi:hypothetical protein